jgi:hypothetical protein
VRHAIAVDNAQALERLDDCLSVSLMVRRRLPVSAGSAVAVRIGFLRGDARL